MSSFFFWANLVSILHFLLASRHVCMNFRMVLKSIDRDIFLECNDLVR